MVLFVGVTYGFAGSVKNVQVYQECRCTIVRQGFPQSIKASWYHDALNFYPDASVIPMMLFQMP